MNVIGLDRKEYKLSFNKTKSSNSNNSSGLHNLARDILHCVFPFDIIYEEVYLSGTKIRGRTNNLICDFFIPTRRLIVEIQGQQHYKYIHFFHKNKIEYQAAIKRDKDKKEWCMINNIGLIELKYDESDEWEQRISEFKGS